MTVQLAALDIAGTTLDEGGAVYRVLEAVVREHGAHPDDTAIRAWMDCGACGKNRLTLLGDAALV